MSQGFRGSVISLNTKYPGIPGMSQGFRGSVISLNTKYPGIPGMSQGFRGSLMDPCIDTNFFLAFANCKIYNHRKSSTYTYIMQVPCMY